MNLQRAVLLLAAVLFLAWLGGRDLWAPNEPYFAEGAREMVVDGNWAVPHVNGVITTDKPPLFFWLISLFSLPVGKVTLWTSRLPSVFAALGTLAITMRLGQRFYGPKTAALGGLVLTISYMFWEQARWVQTDALLCFLIWVALCAFVEFRDRQSASEAKSGQAAGLLFWLAIALAVLTKGPVGLLLPLGIAIVVLISDRRTRLWRRFAPWTGPGLMVLVLAVWILVATLGSGGDYSVWGALKEHFIDRGIHGLHHRRPPWYYLKVLPAVIMPWTFLLPGALLLAWRRRQPFDRFLLVTAFFIVVFFSISTEKRELYALPALPAFALMIATLTATLCGWGENRTETGPTGPGGETGQGSLVSERWISRAQPLLGVLLLAVAIFAPFAARDYDFLSPSTLVLFVAILAATGAVTLHAAWTGRLSRSVLAPAAGFAVLYLLVASVIWPAFEPVKSARAFSMTLEEATRDYRRAGGVVLTYELVNLPHHFAFYTNGLYTDETNSVEKLREHLAPSEPAFAVVDGDKLGGLPPALLARLETVAEAKLARKRVLLVSNTRATAPPAEG